MKKTICSFFYYELLGWRTKISVPDYDKYIICAAPHTSNWDLIIGKLFMGAIGRKTSFLIKKDWFFWPLGWVIRWLGGIPVNRTRKTSMVHKLIRIAQEKQTFHLAITPEGTRSANPHWKSGFYYIAQGANLPIVLFAIDYKKKCITAEKVIRPDGNIDKDLREIQLYYQRFEGKHPERFRIPELSISA